LKYDTEDKAVQIIEYKDDHEEREHIILVGCLRHSVLL
jgi:hypothetical protein